MAPGRLGQRSSDDSGTRSRTHRCAMNRFLVVRTLSLLVATGLPTGCGCAVTACRRSDLRTALDIMRPGAGARDPGLVSPSAYPQVPLSEVEDDLSRYLRPGETEEVAITRHGKPAGVLIGFGSEDDWFGYQLEHDPASRRRIESA